VRALKLFGFPNPTYSEKFEIYVGDNSNYHLNTRCPSALIPRVLGFLAPMYSTAAFGCDLNGRYVAIHAPGLNVVLQEMQVFVANLCPARMATGATQLGGSTCQNAGWGQVCTYVCNAGFVPVVGSESSTCNGASWDAPELICRRTCPDLLPPPYAVSCSQVFYTQSFNIDGALLQFQSLDPFRQAIGFPTVSPPQAARWYQIDGSLQASNDLTYLPDLHLAIASSKIQEWVSGFSLSASVMTSTRGGLFFRAQNNANLVRFWFDTTTGDAAVERLEQGAAFEISRVNSYLFKTPKVWNSVAVSVQNAQVNVTFNGMLVITTADLTFLNGFAGVYAQGSAFFDDLTYQVACEFCSGMTDGTTCTFGCDVGLLAVGPLSRSCVGATQTYNPDAVAQPLVCTLAAPTFTPSTLFVLENSPANANVGDPLISTSTSNDYQVQFQITDVFAMGAFMVPASNFTPYTLGQNQALFWVDVCSGQVKVRAGGASMLNYEGVNSYLVQVRTFISGFAGAEVTKNVTVVVLNVDEPPVALSSTVTLPENAAVGSDGATVTWASLAGVVAGAVSRWDPENSTLAFILSVDGSAGRLVMNNATGVVSVPSSLAGPNGTSSLVPFNFETTSGSGIQLNVRVVQVNDSMMVSQATITVLVGDLNDPPLVNNGQIFTLSEYADVAIPSLSPLVAGVVLATDEDKNASFANASALAFNLVAAASAGAVCGQTSGWATTTGAVGGAPLLSVSSTGQISLAAMPVTLWRDRSPIVSTGGQLLRASYSLCVRATDVGLSLIHISEPTRLM
jgi:hypothetical protein